MSQTALEPLILDSADLVSVSIRFPSEEYDLSVPTAQMTGTLRLLFPSVPAGLTIRTLCDCGLKVRLSSFPPNYGAAKAQIMLSYTRNRGEFKPKQIPRQKTLNAHVSLLTSHFSLNKSKSTKQGCEWNWWKW